MRKKLYVGISVAAAVLLGSISARALIGSANDVRHVKSQPRKRITSAMELGLMPTADDLLTAQSVVLSEHRRVAAKLPQRYSRWGGRALPLSTGVPGLTWVNSGPTDASYEFNFSGVYGVDSGRPTAIIVDPRDPNVVYNAVSGGGVWKTYNFVTGYPTPSWIPIGDTLPNLAIGALAIDPSAPDTLYLGTGDSFDVGGNQVFKSTDGGATWSSTPLTLSGTAPGTAVTFRPAAIRDIRVDPENGMNILLASDQGLFRSTDGGTTFNYVDLPNATANVMEATWSLAYLGNHQWLVSGVQACDTANKARGPRAGFGQYVSAGCTLGNLGDIWRSTNSGAAWTSLRNTTGALPPTTLFDTSVPPKPVDDIGRMTLAAGPTSDPTKTAVYVFIGDTNESFTYGFFRSTNAGQTFVDATGTLANPTLAAVFQGQTFNDCGDLDVAHGQVWYNQAILVDPTNADHVLVGGNLCGMRTLNGTSSSPTWENVSHWLPTAGSGTTSAGILPYVHADWHAQAAFVLDGKVHAVAGTDGGIFSASNLWDPSTTPPNINWANHNRGLANHLFYNIASGDPAYGDANIVYGGLQDNGTRWRSDVTMPTTFNQIIGGDGIGAAISHGTAGVFMWGSSEFNYDLCASPAGAAAPTDCSNPSNWNATAPSVTVIDPGPKRPDPTDSSPFFVRFAPVTTDALGYGMLTNTNFQVWLYAQYTPPLPPGGTQTVGWETVPVTPVPPATTPTTGSLISPDFSLQGAPKGPAAVVNMAAHSTTANVFGVALAGQNAGATSPAAVTLNATQTVGAPGTLSQPATNRGSWIFAKPVTVGNAGTGHLQSPQSIAFPISQTGAPGNTYILSFASSRYSDGTVVPASVGKLFRTTDGGQTWASIVGADPLHQLPNVPVWVVKYDPVTAGVIYAGTLIGVYISKDNGVTWDRFGAGLPMVSVRDIYVAKNSDFLRIATYGRGVWEIYPSATENQGVAGDGDYDRNLQLDWIDLSAMGARLGTNPSTAAAPLYTWIDDMNSGTTNPPTAGIDENDLGSLLAGFGGHP